MTGFVRGGNFSGDDGADGKGDLGFSWRVFFKHICYPLLCSVAVFVVLYSLNNDVDFGLSNISFLFFCIAYLSFFEWVIPHEKKWKPSMREWGRDGLYLFVTMIGGASSVYVLFLVAAKIAPYEPVWSLWLEVPAALVLGSLGTYIFHRLGHDWPWLWRFHGIHHAEGKVNVGNNAVNHIFDVFGRRLLSQLPFLFLGLSQPAFFIVSIFNIMQGYFVHANVDVKLGVLNYFIGSPEQHRLHHSVDVKEAGHFCVDITLWDWVFKSYFWRKNKQPKAVGILNPDRFPPPNAIIKSFIHPFK